MKEKKKSVQEEILEESDIVELVDENNKVLKFHHIGTLEYKKNWYAVFQPAEAVDGMDDDEVVIFAVTSDKEDSDILSPIEDQDLLDEVYEEFCRLMEEEADDGEELDGCDCHSCKKKCK